MVEGAQDFVNTPPSGILVGTALIFGPVFLVWGSF